MNKTININLAGIIFHVDEAAYDRLTQYLRQIKSYLTETDSHEEILQDVESRIAELFNERLAGTSRQVIGISDVTAVIEIMGAPESYKLDDEGIEEDSRDHRQEWPEYKGERKFFRNREDKIVAGVASGISAYFGVDPVWIRLLFLVGTFIGGPGIIIYIILWIIIPEAKTTAQKLQMRGEPVNFANIERKIRTEMSEVEASVKSFASRPEVKDSANKAVSGLQRFINFILEAFGLLFKFIFKVVGVLFIIGATILLIFTFGLAWDNNVVINGEILSFSFSDLRNSILSLVFENWQINMLAVTAILSAMIPIILMILLGARILFKYKVKNHVLTGLFLVVPILSIPWIWTGISTARDFKVEGSVTQEIALEADGQNYWRVMATKPSAPANDIPWFKFNDRVYLKRVNLDIKESPNEVPGMEIKFHSRGRTSEIARELAATTDYFYEIADSVITLDGYFALHPFREGGAKFRGQKVQATLYLPVGHQIYLDETVLELLKNVPLATGHKPKHEMVNHTYIMTRNGLICNSCLFEKESIQQDPALPRADTRKMKKLREKQEKLEKALEELKEQMQEINADF
jgi:phage shock protein PspC (stress-responsive transcriptional regulator)